MTLLPRFTGVRAAPSVLDQERIFDVRPGVRLVAHCGWQASPRAAPTLLLLHGLCGFSNSPYMIEAATRAHALGYNVVRLNQRGCGGTIGLCHEPYHAGLTEDIEHVVDELSCEDRLPALFIAGFSLGGSQLLNYLGKRRDALPPAVRGACAVAVSIRLAEAVRRLHHPENWLYEAAFLWWLYRRQQERCRIAPGRYPLPPAWRVTSMGRFDDMVQAPQCGFRDAGDYYESASSAPYLAHIAVPTLLIQAQDDPMIPFDVFERTPMSKSVLLLAPRHGGHVGFVGQAGDGEDEQWAQNRMLQFFDLLRDGADDLRTRHPR